MSRLIVLYVLLLVARPLWAADYNVVSLFSDAALVTDRFLPFKVYNEETQPQVIKSVSTSSDCESLVDPNRNTVFHLHCNTAGEVNMSVQLSNGQKISVGPLQIRAVSILKPRYDDAPDEVSLGQTLFQNNCAECHATVVIRTPITVDGIKSALSRDPMKARGLDSLFNDDLEKLEALEEYINGR